MVTNFENWFFIFNNDIIFLVAYKAKEEIMVYTGGFWLHVIVASMFGGKTESLIYYIKRARIAGQKVQVFKPAFDDRYDAQRICTHDGLDEEAIVVKTDREILELVDPDTKLVAVDEGQFFGRELPDVCEWLANKGYRVIVAGLAVNAIGSPFNPMPDLMARADHVTTLHAICTKCGQLASKTQLLRNGNPIPWQKEEIRFVGDEKDGFEARCRKCWKVPGRPEFKEKKRVIRLAAMITVPS